MMTTFSPPAVIRSVSRMFQTRSCDLFVLAGTDGPGIPTGAATIMYQGTNIGLDEEGRDGKKRAGWSKVVQAP